MRRRTKAIDPYAILDEPGRRRHPLLPLPVPLLVLVVFLGLLAYVASKGDDPRLPDAPSGGGRVPGGPGGP